MYNNVYIIGYKKAAMISSTFTERFQVGKIILSGKSTSSVQNKFGCFKGALNLTKEKNAPNV